MIGLGMLGFLIPYDAVLALFGRGQNRTVGEVDGVTISMVDYQTAVQRRQGLFTYNTTQALENEVWNDMLEQALLGDDYNALGLSVNKEEFDEIRFGDNVSPYVQRTFYGNTVTDEARENWRRQFSQMYNDPTGQGRANYEGYSDVIVQKRLREKYDALVTKGIYANSLEGKYEYLSGQEKVNIDYVFAKYDQIADSLVDVSESDVRAYYNRHKEDKAYEQVKSRNIEYFKIPVEPSEGDINAINEEMNGIVEEWKGLENDSTFVVARSATNRYISRQLKESLAVSEEDKQLFEAEPGTVIGPFKENGVMKAMKAVRITEVADSSVSCRHILLKSNTGTDEEIDELMARADSLKRRYKAGEDWDDLVKRFSEDPGSKDKGGVYDYFPRGQMVKPFENFCFDNPVGTIGAVETTYGVHLIEVTDQRWSVKQAAVAEISRELKPSVDTKKNAYRKASEFAINFNDYASFAEAADTMGYAVIAANNVRPNATTVSGGLRNAGELVSWAFQSEKGEVSQPILIDDNYIIASVTKIMEAGIPPFENVEEEMREGATKEAKAEYMMKELEAAENLEQAASIAGTTVRTARNVTLKSATIPGSGGGAEPKVAGLAFSIPQGNMSLPIEGESGIWVIAPSSEVTQAEEKDDYFTDQDQATTRLRAGVSTRLFNAIKEGAELVDDRQ